MVAAAGLAIHIIDRVGGADRRRWWPVGGRLCHVGWVFVRNSQKNKGAFHVEVLGVTSHVI